MRSLPEQPERGEWPEDRAERVHHALEAERPAVGLRRDSRGQQRLAPGRARAASQPRRRASQQDMPSVCGKCQRSGAQSGEHVARKYKRFAPCQPVGVVARRQLGDARKPVGGSFDDAEPPREARNAGRIVVATSWLQSLKKLVSPTPTAVRFNQGSDGMTFVSLTLVLIPTLVAWSSANAATSASISREKFLADAERLGLLKSTSSSGT